MKDGEKNMTSAIHNFYKFPLAEKIKILKKFCNLTKGDLELLKKYQKLPDFFPLENNIGPFKVATNFLINGKDYFVPMETEEPSVVAAASKGADLFRSGGGFFGRFLSNEMVGQIQILGVKNFKEAKEKIIKNKEKILKIVNDHQKELFELGGGAKNFQLKKIKNYLIFYLFVNPKDALGANTINSMLEKIAPYLAFLLRGKIVGSIVSNFGGKRIVEVEGKIPIAKLKRKKINGKEVAKKILYLFDLAKNDLFRTITHNKGIMNGVDAVLLATGNDFRAAESAIHSFAVKSGKYSPLNHWEIKDDFLEGKIKIPMPVAIVGGATNTKKAKLAKKILRVKTAEELGIVCASVGLANNLAAILAIVTEGIQKGHSKIHRQFLKLCQGK
jgi:hydroxymethylglutaryl-CoA reductase